MRNPPNISSHSCLLLLSGAGAAVLRAGLVELPDEVEGDGAAGGVVGREFADAVDDGGGLVGVQDVVAAEVGGQRAEAAQVEVVLHAEREVETLDHGD